MISIVCISDTHGLHDQVDVPVGDILIHAGDCTNVGHPHELAEFLVWFSALPHRNKILVGGNHDWLFERDPDAAMALLKKHAPSVHYLNDSGVTIAGLKIWGSPVTPAFCDWAFNRQRGPEIKFHRDLIPIDVDVLVTHGPPEGILDDTAWGLRAGCADLTQAIKRLTRLRLAVFGHLHLEGGRQKKVAGVTYVNAAVCDEAYRPIRSPVIVALRPH
jgi:Icc-related predicted phosphoesterase